MIHPCLTNTSSIYTLELVFSILADNLLGFQSATSAVYTVSMSRSADQSLVHESDLIEDRDYDTEDARSSLPSWHHAPSPLRALELASATVLIPQ